MFSYLFLWIASTGASDSSEAFPPPHCTILLEVTEGIQHWWFDSARKERAKAEKEKTDKLSLKAAAINAQMHSNFSSVLDTAVIIHPYRVYDAIKMDGEGGTY